MRLVADISVWQTEKPYNLDQFAGAVDAAWVRFTDWQIYAQYGPDPDYRHCVDYLRDVHRKPVGSYLFCRPGMSDPHTQVDTWADNAPVETWAPMLDLEVTGGLSGTALSQWTDAALARMAVRFGRIPWLYTQASKVASWGLVRPPTPHLLIVAGYPFGYDPFHWGDRGGWEARAMSRPPDTPQGWNHWDAWQFTSSAEVPGMTDGIDCELCTEDAYQQSASGGGDTTDMERDALRVLRRKLGIGT